MLALTTWRAGRCPGCGEQLAESTSADHDRDNRKGSHYYHVDAPTRCHACTAKHLAEERFKRQAGDRAHSVFFRPVLRERKPR